MRFGYAGGATRQMVIAMAAVAAVEIPVAHLLLMRWSDAAAIAVTAVSVAFVAWVLADLRAATRRPIVLGDTALTIPRGLRRVTVVPLGTVVAARIVPSSDGLPSPALRTVYGPEATAVIELDPPLPDGRAVVAVSVDDPRGFVDMLGAAVSRT